MVDLAAVALRAVVEAVADDPEAARAALVALLGAPGPAPVASAPPAPTTVVHRDLKPANVLPAKPRRKPAADELQPDGEGATLVRALIEAHDSISAAARVVPTSAAMLKRWRDGYAVTTRSLKRLRAAVKANEAQGSAPAPVVKVPRTTVANAHGGRVAKARKAKAKQRGGRRPVADAPDPSPSGARFGGRMRGPWVGRPAAAPIVDEDQGDEPEQDAEQAEPEAPREDDSPAAVVRALVEKHGPLEELEERFGLRSAMLMKILNGGPCTPSCASRLRSALASEPVGARREQEAPEAEEVAGEEPALQPDDEHDDAEHNVA